MQAGWLRNIIIEMLRQGLDYNVTCFLLHECKFLPNANIWPKSASHFYGPFNAVIL